MEQSKLKTFLQKLVCKKTRDTKKLDLLAGNWFIFCDLSQIEAQGTIHM